MENKQHVVSNLYTFNVAAKCLSFTNAAEELHLTQGAVSQRIKQLEQQLGFKLFIRLTRKLELTEEGKRLYETVSGSFSTIFSDIDDIRFNELTGELYIGVAPTFAQSWLLPKLANFQARYPNLNLKIRVKASYLDFNHEPVDLAIYYSREPQSDMHNEMLFEEYLTPVCTPLYAEKHKITDQVSSLANANLIHCTESIDSANYDFEWQHWLKQQTEPITPNANYYVFNHGEMAVSAVKYHMGVGMGRVALIQPYLDSGELIAPFGVIPADMKYLLICPKGMEERPRFKAFTSWLRSQLVEDH
ncbi:LysR substrate-binding domain-containing protein [Vibrio sp. EJY3]|uniref:LysR substrate-binding domain-containing protein n=1 Tax=Vibrio sp. (strain EJY3) TaxID=1116375 RepID=UPI000243B4AC|nr:LysR substrate-binding domain-containing protein [Vibrio sp. EJY3]AEX21370.1 HTH-type transcriptional regulator, LysR family protein [Vibrio sp. EJY3]